VVVVVEDVVLVVVGLTAVSVDVLVKRRHFRTLPTVEHLNSLFPVLRIWPTFLQAVPPIDIGCLAETTEALAGSVGMKFGSGVVAGNIPVSAAVPTVMA
jgi:hypothetical protein